MTLLDAGSIILIIVVFVYYQALKINNNFANPLAEVIFVRPPPTRHLEMYFT